MNTEHLGDAYDLVKKEILKTLKQGLDKPIHVLPMFTDKFEEKNLTFYKNLTSCDWIKDTKIESNKIRGTYFDNLGKLDIVFIDPNTGIRLDAGQCWDSVNLNDISNVATQCNLLVVYDQSFDRSVKKKI